MLGGLKRAFFEVRQISSLSMFSSWDMWGEDNRVIMLCIHIFPLDYQITLQYNNLNIIVVTNIAIVITCLQQKYEKYKRNAMVLLYEKVSSIRFKVSGRKYEVLLVSDVKCQVLQGVCNNDNYT